MLWSLFYFVELVNENLRESIVWSFLLSCVVSTGIDGGFTGFGNRICDSLPGTGEIGLICQSAVKREKPQFIPVFFVVWTVSALGLFALASKKH